MTAPPISVAVDGGIAQVRLERPDRANALHRPMWDALGATFRALDADAGVRVVVLSGAGRHFCAGIDLEMLAEFREIGGGPCAGRAGEAVFRTIVDLQEAVTAITARVVDGREAAALRLVNRCLEDPEQLHAAAAELARELAARSPLAMRGTKRALTYARDHSIAEGLEQVAAWNAATLLSDDLTESLATAKEKRAPTYRD